VPSVSNTGLVNWTWGAWRRESTLAEQIEMLILHIEEVEKFAFESQNKGNRLTLHQNMLPGLEAQLQKLKTQQTLANSTTGRRLGGVARFKRGSGS